MIWVILAAYVAGVATPIVIFYWALRSLDKDVHDHLLYHEIRSSLMRAKPPMARERATRLSPTAPNV